MSRQPPAEQLRMSTTMYLGREAAETAGYAFGASAAALLDMLQGEFMASAIIDPALAHGTAGWPTELVGRVPHDLFT